MIQANESFLSFRAEIKVINALKNPKQGETCVKGALGIRSDEELLGKTDSVLSCPYYCTCEFQAGEAA